jgi:hypothetical protein
MITSTSHTGAEPDSPLKDASPGRKDSSMDVRLPVAPVPFVVVDKVPDKSQPEYGHVEPDHLPTDPSKRAADAKPDLEHVRTDALSTHDHALPLVADEDAAPLFRHESFQASESSHSLADDAEAESLQSSVGLSSGEAINTPSETPESQDNELDLVPLLSHETGFRTDTQEDELDLAPRLPHETGPSANSDKPEEPLLSHEMGGQDEHDELSLAPLLSHESAFGPNDDEQSNDDNELDASPLLSHETGFLQQKRSGTYPVKDEDGWGPQHYHRTKSFEARHAPTIPHESLPGEDHGAPLLPHERTSTGSWSGSEQSFGHTSIPDTNQPTQGYETEYAREIFGRGRPTFFRTNSSTLPHRLPRSDEEDHNLRDASLEPFPVGRDQILARVVTIGNKLPEDETVTSPHSPHGSVFSQACSSVDLVPVKSYTSLASVREDEEEEEEEDDDEDDDSASSPIFMSSSSAAFARDPLQTPHSNDSKQLGFIPEEKQENPSTRTADTSESDSVSRTDGATDNSKHGSKTPELSAAPATLSKALTPPLTPEGKTLSLESQLRQRHEPTKDSTADSTKNDYAATSPQQTEISKDTSVIPLLTSYIGNRKRAR